MEERSSGLVHRLWRGRGSVCPLRHPCGREQTTNSVDISTELLGNLPPVTSHLASKAVVAQSKKGRWRRTTTSEATSDMFLVEPPGATLDLAAFQRNGTGSVGSGVGNPTAPGYLPTLVGWYGVPRGSFT